MLPANTATLVAHNEIFRPALILIQFVVIVQIFPDQTPGFCNCLHFTHLSLPLLLLLPLTLLTVTHVVLALIGITLRLHVLNRAIDSDGSRTATPARCCFS
jgi:hypothetical protein